MNIASLLVRAGLSFPDRPALALGTTVVADYRGLARRVAGLAAGLAGLGLAPGDRVAIASKNAPDYLIWVFAVWHAGLAAVPMNARLHPREFAHALEDGEARLLVVSDELAEDLVPMVGEIATLERAVLIGSAEAGRLETADPIDLVHVAPDALAWLFYTSGTTGRPKGAMLTHRNLMAATLNYFAGVDAIEARDGILHAAPMSHGSGMYMMPHIAAGAVNLVPESGGFDPAEMAALSRHWHGLSLFAAPTMVKRFVDHVALAGPDLPGLKTIVYGGGPMYLADCRQGLEVLGQKLVQIYGQGESPMTITSLPRWCHADTDHPRYLDRLASVGLAFPGVEVMVADAEDKPLPPGEIGEVLVRGDTVMAGYWRNPEATAKALANGWLHTGDVGSFDADGFLTLRDRSKDLIISGGNNIYPREVEEALLTHSAVAEVSVIGKPDPEWGESVVAFVVAEAGAAATEAELDRHCLETIARYKRPKAYVFVDELPKNNYGKVLKTELRTRLS